MNRRLIHKGRKFNFELVEVPTADGRTLTREVVRHPGAVVVLPVLDDGRLCLIRNTRPAIGREILELPAGTLEPGEEPAACARRELAEETGYEAATLAELARFYTSPGMSDELMTAFVARGLRFVGRRPEEDEQLTDVSVGVEEAFAMIDSGELTDAKSVLTLLLARRKGMV